MGMTPFFLIFYIVGISFIILTTISGFFVCLKKQWFVSKAVFIILIGASFYLLAMQFLKYYSLHSYVDFAAWGEILNNIIKTGMPTSSIQGFFSGQSPNYHWFAAHFTPLIYFLAIPFKLLPYNETIIILNGLLMLSSAIPLYKLAVRLQGNKKFGLFMVALLLWYPTFQYITLYEFEMLRFSIPILLWMIYFWEKQKIRLYFLFAMLAIFVREEVGLIVAMFGLYVFFAEKKKMKGIATAVLGLGSFFIITQIVMPFFSTVENFQHVAAGSFVQFGATPVEAIKNMVLHPTWVAAAVLHPVKLANLAMLFIPLLGIPFLVLTALIVILPNIGIGMISGSIEHISYMLYYVAPSIPFIFYAFMKAWPKLVNWFKFPSAIMAAVLSGLLASNIFFGPAPISLQFWSKNLKPAPFRTQDFHYSVYKITDRHKQVEQFVSLIPDKAVVSAQQFLHPRLFKKGGLMVFPQLESKDGSVKADYVLVDRINNNLKPESPAYISEEDFNKVTQDRLGWKLIRSDDGYELYKRIL